MATFFSNQTVGTWSGYTMTGTLTGNVGRSGNTVTLSSLSCTFKAASAWGTDSGYWSAIYNGNTQLTRSNGLSMSSGTGTKSYSNVSITVGASDTSHQFNFRTSDGKTVYFTVTFPSGQTAPTKPTMTLTVHQNSDFGEFQVYWGTTSLGNPAGTVTLYTSVEGEQGQYTEAVTKSTTGNTAYTYSYAGGNRTWWFKAIASNTVGEAVSDIGSLVTAPLPWSVESSLTTATSTTLEMTYNGGLLNYGALPIDLQYSLDNTNWVSIPSAVQSERKQYTITGLTPNTSYTLYSRSITTVGTSKSYTYQFTTLAPAKLYGSVNSQTKQVKKLYGSVNGETKKIKKLYGSVNGQTKLIYQG